MPTRSQYYAMIHMGAARLGYKDEPDYRTWLESLTGKQSLKDCTVHELSSLTTTLRACKALETPRTNSVKGGRGQGGRPTDAQWRMADGLCRRLGLSGCDDPGFLAFAKRTAHVDHPRFLTIKGMSAVLSGLEAWCKSKAEKEGQK